GHRARRLAGSEHDQPSGGDGEVLHKAGGRMRGGDRGVEELFEQGTVRRHGPAGVSSAASREFGRATHIPMRIRTPPTSCTVPSASLRISQPTGAAAIASKNRTSDENVAGRVPSATARSPCPATWLTTASATSAAKPDALCGIKVGSVNIAM